MQQRISSANSRGSGEHRAIDVADIPQTTRRKTDGDDASGLPLYDTRGTVGKREVCLSRSAQKWLRAIPFILLLCFLHLWLNYFLVNETVRDGRTTVIGQIHAPLPNTTHYGLIILAASATPIWSLPQNLSYDYETSLHLGHPAGRKIFWVYNSKKDEKWDKFVKDVNSVNFDR